MIPWNVDDGVTAHLPNMNTDITLKSGEKILIIDAKYYAHTMQTVYDIEKIRSDYLYQMFAYVKNLDKENTGMVAGMILYAKPQEKIIPGNRYVMGGNIIWVRTLDLNQPFTQIAGQLEKIAEDYFGENVMEQNADSIIRRKTDAVF